jgi:Transglycosylase SLT domain
VETSACLAPDRKFNVSIPRTSLQSKSSRLALAATGVAAAVAILVSGGAAAAGSGPAPAYRIAAGGTVSLIQPVAGQAPSPLANLAASQATVAGRTVARQTVAGQNAAADGQSATGQHQPAVHRKPAGRLRLSVGDRLAATTRGTAKNGQRTAPAHKQTARANRRPARARHRVSVCADSRLHWWVCHVEQVLERHGTSRGKLNTAAAYIVVQHESGANPHAYNGWDINAAQGHPSEGIAQVIGPTFHAYALPGYGNIWNPVDNMIAAFRYAISRYGSMNNIPGVVAVRQGGSYVGY